MRLALRTNQFNQAQIISRKINPKIFNNVTDEAFIVIEMITILVLFTFFVSLGFKD